MKDTDNQPTIDILLFCALEDEYNQVLQVKDGLSEQGWMEKHDQSGRIVADGIFATHHGKEITVRTTWMAYMGREQAQAVASASNQNTPVKCIAMSGICAGSRGKVGLGDVVFANRLWSYDAGKLVVEDGVEKFEGDML